jgi:hypothetical protein
MKNESNEEHRSKDGNMSICIIHAKCVSWFNEICLKRLLCLGCLISPVLNTRTLDITAARVCVELVCTLFLEIKSNM